MKRKKIEISRPADVLLVEDNPGDVRLIREAMKEAGFRNNTTVANDGVEAMAVLRREGKYSKVENIDIVILDLNLPRMDGRQVLAEIKKDDKLKHIPVVVLSSSSAQEDIEKSYNSYANCYIIKPLEVGEYTDVIKRIESFWLGIAKLPKKTVKILLVEDNPADARLFEEMLSEGEVADFELESVETLELANKRMDVDAADIIVLDLNLPDSAGFETFSKVHTRFPRTPVIVLTGLKDEEMGLKTVQSGAQAYIMKQELTAPYLVKSILYSIERNKIRLATEELMNFIVHEFRSPMAVIKEGASQILDGLHGAVTDEQREYIAMVYDNAERMEGMVTDLLNMARIDIGTMQMNFAKFNMSDLLTKLFNEYKGIAKKKGLGMSINIPKNAVDISADADRLKQVLVNLVSNSIKFTEKGDVRISMAEDERMVVISIKDTGPGIPSDDLPHIFDKYWQASKKAPKGAKGIGLGLYICKSIIELHYGSIYAKSKLGEGAEIIITLPKEHT